MSIKIDSDSHFSPYDAFDDVDPKFHGRAPRFLRDALGRSGVVYKARTEKLPDFMWNYPTEFRLLKRAPGLRDSDARVEDLDKMGFDRQVLVPHTDLFCYDVEPLLALSVCRSFNNAIARVLKKHPNRFIGLAVVPMQDTSLALEELDRAILELHLHATLIQTNVVDKNLDEYEFWPFYKRVEELGVPIIVHSEHLSVTAGAHRYKKYRFANALGHPAETCLAIGSLVCSGVLDAYPKLRMAFLEAGAGFLPYLFDRLNEVAVEEPEYTRVSIKKLPTDYLDQLWFSFNAKTEAESLPFLIERIGADQLMIGSDYPHSLGGSGLSALEFVEPLETISAGDREKITGLNAARLFGLGG